MKSIPRKTNFHAEEKYKVNIVRNSRMEIESTPVLINYEQGSKVNYNFHAFHLNLPLYKRGVGDSSSASENPHAVLYSTAKFHCDARLPKTFCN
jgi:hypothetical protein